MKPWLAKDRWYSATADCRIGPWNRRDTDIWLPFSPSEAEKQRTARSLRVFGRLGEGSEHRQAQSEMGGIAQQLIAEYPNLTRDLVSVRVETFTDLFIGGAGRAMFLTVMGAVVNTCRQDIVRYAVLQKLPRHCSRGGPTVSAQAVMARSSGGTVPHHRRRIPG